MASSTMRVLQLENGYVTLGDKKAQQPWRLPPCHCLCGYSSCLGSAQPLCLESTPHQMESHLLWNGRTRTTVWHQHPLTSILADRSVSEKQSVKEICFHLSLIQRALA